MFKRPGLLLKKVAVYSFFIEAIAALITAIVIMVENEDFWLSFAIGLGGFCFAWLSALFLFAFGQLVDNSDKTVMLLNGQKINKLEKDDYFPALKFTQPKVESKPASNKKPLSSQNNTNKNKNTSIETPHINNDLSFCPNCKEELNITEDAIIEVCPNCKEELYITKDTIIEVCPFCNTKL